TNHPRTTQATNARFRHSHNTRTRDDRSSIGLYMAHGQESSTEAAAGGGAPLCTNGCGFYGSEASKNMCSKCYRDHLKAGDVAAPAVEGKLTFDDLILAFKKSMSLQDSTAAPAAEAAAKKSAPTRCMACKKKVGLLGFACRCGYLLLAAPLRGRARVWLRLQEGRTGADRAAEPSRRAVQAP
uniref:A20-type domain-containing protein n=1 Tax=Aegilops tauschii subsp. strangulata TaxID=200361 RepID=A0A453AU42_AEGTS